MPDYVKKEALVMASPKPRTLPSASCSNKREAPKKRAPPSLQEQKRRKMAALAMARLVRSRQVGRRVEETNMDDWLFHRHSGCSDLLSIRLHREYQQSILGMNN